MKKILALLALLWLVPLLHGCVEQPENPFQPNAIVNITIYPNTLQYYNLNFVGGYQYLTSDPQSNSRGLIVYRMSMDEFRVYDRLPPNDPNTCCENGVCSRLVVDLPFVVDSCNMIRYNILNGQVFDGDGIFPLFPYQTSFDGFALQITN